MPPPSESEESLRTAFTGLVVESLAVRQDVATGTVVCDRCRREGRTRRLGVGDNVVVVLRNYEGFTWELQDVRCPIHGFDTVAEAVGVDADDQAVVSAVLERAGYHSPDGEYYPEALTLGAVDIIDYSPATEGYEDG